MAAPVPVGVTDPDTGRRRRSGRRRLAPERVLFFAVFLVIPLAVYIMFVVSPFLQSFYYSLTDWRGVSADLNFIGLSNYERILNDATFLRALRNNVIMMVVLPLVTIGLAYALAIIITVGGDTRGGVQGIGGAGFYRVVSLFPYVIPAVIVGILFNFIYNPNGGLLNGVLQLVGIDANRSWLGDPRTALIAVMAAIIWSFVGFYMVLFVAAIKAVPKEMFEAARLDGAGRWRTAVQIAAPQVWGNISTALVYMGILALDGFVYVSVMTPNGGTGDSTMTVSLYMYQAAFTRSQFGQASAMGVVMALLTMVMAFVVLSAGRRKEKR